MQNIPEVSLGIIAVSRDCFPIALSEKRRAAIIEACGGGLYECPVTVENEKDMCRAVEDVKKAGCNASITETRSSACRSTAPASAIRRGLSREAPGKRESQSIRSLLYSK